MGDDDKRFEHAPTDNGPSLEAWWSDAIGKIRVASTPGGVSLDVAKARELRDVLDTIVDDVEQETDDADV